MAESDRRACVEISCTEVVTAWSSTCVAVAASPPPVEESSQLAGRAGWPVDVGGGGGYAGGVGGGEGGADWPSQGVAQTYGNVLSQDASATANKQVSRISTSMSLAWSQKRFIFHTKMTCVCYNETKDGLYRHCGVSRVPLCQRQHR